MLTGTLTALLHSGGFDGRRAQLVPYRNADLILSLMMTGVISKVACLPTHAPACVPAAKYPRCILDIKRGAGPVSAIKGLPCIAPGRAPAALPEDRGMAGTMTDALRLPCI